MEEAFCRISAANPELAAEFERTQKGVLKAGWEKAIPSFATDKPVATRNAGGAVMNAIAERCRSCLAGRRT